MAALGYEFYLLVLKVSLTSERSEHKNGRTEGHKNKHMKT